VVKKILWTALLLFAILAAAVIVRTAMTHSRQVAAEQIPPLTLDQRRITANLSGAIQFPTVSSLDALHNHPDELALLREFLEQTYPRVHATLARESIGDRGQLYIWKGSDPAAHPILLLAHLDVVPIEPGTESKWTHPPFSGQIADGYVWGRGALDDKLAAIAILESVEWLLDQGFTPRRTVYVALGGDEEIGGLNGAAKIAAALSERGIHAEYVLDEGEAVLEGIVPGVAAPVALVGVTEKGYVSAELTVDISGGHSSMPPPHTTVGILSAAIVRLEKHQMPARLDGAPRLMLEYLAPEMPLPRKAVVANLWLFGGSVRNLYARSPVGNTQIRTTTAATMFEGSPKDNVLPARARAVVNFRILPGDSVAAVLEHVRKVIDDPRVKIAALGALEPAPVSDHESPAFTLLAKTIRQVFPKAVVAPALVVGGTDSRHYSAISNNIYRFVPVTLREEDLGRFHGINERVAVGDCLDAVRFYIQLLRNTAQ